MKKFKAVLRGGKDGKCLQDGVASSTTTNLHDDAVEPGPSALDLPAITFLEGIKELHPCDDAVVDICFVHGLTGDREETWTATTQQAPWPKLLLPQRLRRARILTWGYDAYLVRKGVASSNRLIDHSTNLMNDLTTDRAEHNASSRSLIFVAHSLGGLVCKQAIMTSRDSPAPHLKGIFMHVKGIAFMGTPHTGSWMANWAKIPAWGLGVVKSSNKSLLSILQTEDQLLESLQISFLSMIRDLRDNQQRRVEVTCFFEELPLPLMGKVVSKASATFSDYPLMSIHANHGDMVKFATMEDNGFRRLAGELIRWELELSTHAETCESNPQLLPSTGDGSSSLPAYVHWMVPRSAKPLFTGREDLLYNQELVASVSQKVLQSLHFAQIRDRRDHVHIAHDQTYRWLLSPVPNGKQRWDDFSTWLGSCDEHRKIFWIHGKPGSGKSTLMRFLDDNIDSCSHLSRWAGNETVVRAQYFFWNSGLPLQKSLLGLIQSLVSQLLEHLPDSIPHVVSPRILKTAQTLAWQDIEWSVTELRDTLRKYLLYCGQSRRVFLLIDGLDEFDGNDEQRDELIDLLVNLTAFENIKICLSSRPWNIFQDSFSDVPQIKLEDLTSQDIDTFVRDELSRHRCFQQWSKYDAVNAQRLYGRLVQKADGVFLWVRLVVRELLTGLRDGDGISALRKKLEDIPADLNLFFKKLFESIEPRHRREASAILQITLHKEVDFVTTDPVSLIDLSFIEEIQPDFAIQGDFAQRALNLNDSNALYFRIESTLRRLNSRCMGLIECHHEPTFASMSVIDLDRHRKVDTSFILKDFDTRNSSDTISGIRLDDSLGPPDVFDLRVDFLHRSFRDYLLSPEAQDLLHEYTDGPYYVRMFMCNALLAKLMALNERGISTYQTTSFMSGLLSRMAVMDSNDPVSLLTFTHVAQPVIEHVALNRLFIRSPLFDYYVEPALTSWAGQQSSFLSLAIDFGLKSCVKAHLNSESISNKRGRPILDYVLRPRFAMQRGTLDIGNSLPDIDLLRSVLELGADPNEQFHFASVWAYFLCFVREPHPEPTWSASTEADNNTYFGAMILLLQYGAARILPKTWLSEKCDYGQYGKPALSALAESADESDFEKRWPDTSPIQDGYEYQEFYAVSDLVEHLRFRFGARVDSLKALLATNTDQAEYWHDYYQRAAEIVKGGTSGVPRVVVTL